jgi:hypothetical protein
VDRVREPNQFLVPRHLLRPISPSPTRDPFSTPNNTSIPTSEPVQSIAQSGTVRSGKKRSAPHDHPIECSDDERPFSSSSQESSADRAIRPPFKRNPHTVLNIIESQSLGDESKVTDDEQKDTRPIKKRRPGLPIRPNTNSSSSRSMGKQSNRAKDSRRVHRSNTAHASQTSSTLNSSDEESVSFPTSSVKHRNPNFKFNTIKPFKDESSDTPEESDTDSEVSEGLTSPTRTKSPKTPRGNQNERVLKDRTKTKATPWLHTLVISSPISEKIYISNDTRPDHTFQQL